MRPVLRCPLRQSRELRNERLRSRRIRLRFGARPKARHAGVEGIGHRRLLPPKVATLRRRAGRTGLRECIAENTASVRVKDNVGLPILHSVQIGLPQPLDQEDSADPPDRLGRRYSSSNLLPLARNRHTSPATAIVRPSFGLRRVAR